MELSIYTGQETDKVKTELEGLGYRVIIVDNSNNPKDNSISLVVRAKEIEKQTIELIE